MRCNILFFEDLVDRKMQVNMNRVLFRVIVLAGLLLATGCEKWSEKEDWIVDWAPVEIYITATDDDGNSIISPDMPGMTLTFKGETYTVKDWKELSVIQTRAYLAVLHGLFAQPYNESDGKDSYRLYFGEIDGAVDMDEDIVLKWPDGSSDTIHYHCSDHYNKGRGGFGCDRSWKLNGDSHKGSIFTFTGKSF